MNNYDFTVAIYMRDAAQINNAIESILCQSARIQIIVIDAECSELSKEAAEYWAEKSESVCFKAMKDEPVASAYNTAKAMAQGKYISFIQSDATYAEDTFKLVKKCFENTDLSMVSICPVYQNPQGGKDAYVIRPKASGIYSVFEEPANFQFNLHGYFFNRESLCDINFEACYGEECVYEFLLRVFCQMETYQYIAEKKIFYLRGTECNASTYELQYQKSWYFESLTNLLMPYAEKLASMPQEKQTWMACALFYLLAVRYKCNYNSANKGVLNREEVEAFYDLTGQFLTFISDHVILLQKKIGRYTISRALRICLMKAKFKALNIPFAVRETEDGYSFDYGDAVDPGRPMPEKQVIMGRPEREKVYVTAINYEHKAFEIDARVTLDDLFEHDQINMVVKSNGQSLEVKEIYDYPLIKCFGITIQRKYRFHVSIPVDFTKDSQEIVFCYMLNGREVNLQIKGRDTAAKIGKKEYGYWAFDKKRILYLKDNRLICKKASFLTKMRRELSLIRYRMRVSVKKKRMAKLLLGRVVFKCIRPFFKNKRIWITFDKLYKAGDNGEYMYHYIHDNVPDVKIYYVIKKDSNDYERLKKEKANLLIHCSWKCRFMALLSEVILATHSSVWEYCGFQKKVQPLFKEFFTGEIVCIQHGLTIQKIAQFQSRIFDNTRFYCCASKYEVDNIRKPIFGYSEEQISLTGLARYDGLKNNDQKQILITPTWRRDIVNGGIAYNQKTYNNHFKNTEYYRIYNSLINDEDLIACAKKCGYHIIYLLHPAMSAQLDDYDKNDYVELMAATGNMSYEKILTESSLMVTDYSGVQFDFAYMRKPVVYYHPESLPPQYEEGGLIYDTMGFGPICKNHEEIIKTLCEYMEHNCENTEVYVERANDFFAYDDYENCRRIYEAVEDYLKEKKVDK